MPAYKPRTEELLLYFSPLSFNPPLLIILIVESAASGWNELLISRPASCH